MIRPHASDQLNPLYISDDVERERLQREAESWPSILLSSAGAANAVMLAAGYFNPLPGYMNKKDTLSVADNMHTTTGLFWPVPVMNLQHSVEGIFEGMRVALRDPNMPGQPIMAVQNIESIDTLSDEEMTSLLQGVFATTDPEHPGVKATTEAGRILLSGPIQVLNYSYFAQDFPGTFRTAPQLRQIMQQRGWNKVVAFQTRNPMHRAHEELCRMAMEQTEADGLLVHMLLGKLKPGDIPADVRDKAIRVMVDKYFAPDTVLVAGYGFDMLYAGPREAVLHAVFRQNAGCSHLIVGRDHAGVGSYYGPFDAQAIFSEQVAKDELEIEIFAADHTAWSKKLGRVVMMRDVPDHGKDDFILLSGTKVREMLGRGEAPPPEFSRPEVADVLMQFYQAEAQAAAQ